METSPTSTYSSVLSTCSTSESIHPRPLFLLSDLPSFSDLIQDVECYQKRMELDAIERIRKKNKELRADISLRRKLWLNTITILQEAFQSMILLEASSAEYKRHLHYIRLQEDEGCAKKDY